MFNKWYDMAWYLASKTTQHEHDPITDTWITTELKPKWFLLVSFWGEEEPIIVCKDN